MGGEGSMAAANNSLKLNRGQLKKRKDRKGFEGSYAHVKIKEFPKTTPLQLRAIKEKMHRENAKERVKQLVFLCIAFAILISLIGYLII